MPPNNPYVPKLRIPVTYIATMKPTTPTISAIGNTIAHTLRCGGIGALTSIPGAVIELRFCARLGVIEVGS